MITDKERVALALLRETGVDVVELAVLARELMRVGRGNVKRARRCMELGVQELRRGEKTVCFAQAVRAGMEERRGRRARTISDFCYVTRRFMRLCPGLAKRRVRGIRPEECANWITRAFDTEAQRKKARSILSGVFSTAIRQGWCDENPVRLVSTPHVVEKPISILSNEEIERLLDAAKEYENGACLAAVGMMLYAGIRPHEVERLRWEDVQAEAGAIRISPQHSKTGGARCVTIHPPLARILRRVQKDDCERICPPNWRKLWAGLHKAAGFTHWQPDVLRHTFATHHLATFRSYAELQLEMGHRSAELLRTRYVAMEGFRCGGYRQGDSMLVG